MQIKFLRTYFLLIGFAGLIQIGGSVGNAMSDSELEQRLLPRHQRELTHEAATAPAVCKRSSITQGILDIIGDHGSEGRSWPRVINHFLQAGMCAGAFYWSFFESPGQCFDDCTVYNMNGPNTYKKTAMCCGCADLISANGESRWLAMVGAFGHFARSVQYLWGHEDPDEGFSRVIPNPIGAMCNFEWGALSGSGRSFWHKAGATVHHFCVAYNFFSLGVHTLSAVAGCDTSALKYASAIGSGVYKLVCGVGACVELFKMCTR